VTLSGGAVLHYDHLISTMPLPVLIRQMGEEAPAEIREAAARLRHVSVRCVHIGVGRENVTDKHWIYYPEDTVFHRIFVQGNASPHCNPPGGFGFTCEITYSPHKPLPLEGDILMQRCIEDARRVGFIRPDDRILATVQCDLPYAYVVYDHGRTAAVAHIREWLAERDILLAGRYSEWEYYNSDHAFIAGKKAADQIKELDLRQTAPALRAASAEGVPDVQV
jgi:UDP-galactopyranose mutase